MADKKESWEESAANWKIRYPTSTHQAEFFLAKFSRHGVGREGVSILLQQFQKFDAKKQGELEEDEALHLLESRGETKTSRELRTMVADIDKDKNHKLSFLEFACAVLGRSWQTLHEPTGDPNALADLQKLKIQTEQWKSQSESERESRREEEEKALGAYLQKTKEKEMAEQKHADLTSLQKKKQDEEEKQKKRRRRAKKIGCW